MHHAMGNVVAICMLLIFTLTLSVYETKRAKLHHYVIPLVLFVIFLLTEYFVNLNDPYHDVDPSIEIWMALFRSTAYSIVNLYVYCKLYLTFLQRDDIA